MTEKVVQFGKKGNLIGIMCDPETPLSTDSLAVLLLDAGMIHKVGPNRLHVTLARMLANLGFCSLRFDFSGVGDSEVLNNNLTYEEYAVKETLEAMDYISDKKFITRFILMGICTGGDIALKSSFIDKRVVGIIAINAIYFEKTRLQLLDDLENVDKKIINEFFSIKPIQLLIDNNVKLLLLYSQNNYRSGVINATILKDLQKLKNERAINLRLLQDVDYVLTPLWAQDYFINITHEWVDTKFCRM